MEEVGVHLAVPDIWTGIVSVIITITVEKVIITITITITTIIAAIAIAITTTTTMRPEVRLVILVVTPACSRWWLTHLQWNHPHDATTGIAGKVCNLQGVSRKWTPGNLAKSQALYEIRHLKNIQVSSSCL